MSEKPSASLDSPTDLKRKSWLGVLKRTAKEFQDDNLTDWAAALTYYALLRSSRSDLLDRCSLGGHLDHSR